MTEIESIQLLKIVDESVSKFVLDRYALEKLLLNEDIKDRSVVVISIAGAFRKGKSFLLSFFLKYLNFKYGANKKTESLPEDKLWMGDEGTPLKGFRWKCGRDRVTTGLQIWPEIFCPTLPNGDKVAIILLDTQGMFDNQTTFENNAKIFALSTMISSLQIYNLSQHIQEDNLQLLKFFTDYGAEAVKVRGNMPNAPFGKLLFLVRDWQFADETGYGYKGGRKVKDDVLKIKDDQKPELKSVRRLINLSFSDIDGFLMPHPGFEVAENSEFDGRLSDVRKQFKESLNELLPSLLAPENLIPKVIEGRKINATELVEYIGLYVDKLNSDKMPTPRGIIDANAEMSYRLAFEDAINEYKRIMEIVCGSQYAVDTTTLARKNTECSESAFTRFRNHPKFRNENLVASYQTKIKEEIDRLYSLYYANNQKKKEINELKSSVSNQQYQITSLQSDTRAQQRRIDDLKESERNQQSTIESLRRSERYNQERFSNMERRYNEIDQTKSGQQQQINELNKQNSLNRGHITRLEQKIQEKEKLEKELGRKLMEAVVARPTADDRAPKRRRSWSNNE